MLLSAHHRNISEPLVTEGLIVPPLEAGVRAMCLNQILKDEQIELIRYSEASDISERNSRQRRLSMFGPLLQAHPYPHRPYLHHQVADVSATQNEEGAS